MDNEIYQYFYQTSNLTNYDMKDPEEVETIIIQYKSGDDDASYELIKAMLPFLNKYYHLIRYGAGDTKDKDTLEFVKLFIDHPEAKEKLKHRKFDSQVITEINKALVRIKQNYQFLEDRDIIQEIITSFLELARRYEKKFKEINFCGYAYNAYRYQIYMNLKKCSADACNNFNNISYNDIENIEYLINDEDDINQYDKTLFPFAVECCFSDEGELDSSWCQGDTCDNVFKDLSQLERLVIKLVYYDKLSYSAIARITGFERRTIKNYCIRGVEKIKEHLDETQLY